MSNPPSSSGGGMPKILIIVIVVVLVIVVGCCGGIRACSWLFGKGVQTIGSAGQKLSEEAQRKIGEAQKQQQQSTQNNPGPSNPLSAGSPSVNNGGGGSPSAPGNPSAPVVSVKIPANFPGDIPVYDGLICTTSISDKINGTGTVVFTGNAASDTLSDYYEKQMAGKGWKEESNTAINGSYIQSYSKDGRKSSVSIVNEGSGKNTTVSISYEKD